MMGCLAKRRQQHCQRVLSAQIAKPPFKRGSLVTYSQQRLAHMQCFAEPCASNLSAAAPVQVEKAAFERALLAAKPPQHPATQPGTAANLEQHQDVRMPASCSPKSLTLLDAISAFCRCVLHKLS